MAVTLKSVGMLQIPCTWVSSRPLEFDLSRGKHKIFNLRDQWMSVCCLQDVQSFTPQLHTLQAIKCWTVSGNEAMV